MPRSWFLLRRRRGADVDGRADGREGESPPAEPHRRDAGKCGGDGVSVLPDHVRRRHEDEEPRRHPPIRHRGAPGTVAPVDPPPQPSAYAVKGFSIPPHRWGPGGGPLVFPSYPALGAPI